MMKLVNAQTISQAIRDYNFYRFPENELSIFNIAPDQIVMLVDQDSEAPHLTKFAQVMEHLTFPYRGFFKTFHAAEAVFEETLVKFGLPLRPAHTQQTEYVHRPPVETNLIDTYHPGHDRGNIEKIKAELEKLMSCFRKIDAALALRKTVSYKRPTRQHRDQTMLNDFMVQRVGSMDQAELGYFEPPSPESTRQERLSAWRKLRLDVVYDLDEPLAKLVAEVKPKTTVSRGILIERRAQLESYHAWLVTNGDDNLTPLLRILPTTLSHKEEEMSADMKEETGRDTVTVTVTTKDFLMWDLEKRSRVISGLEGAFAKGKNINEYVLEAHRKEADHVSRQMDLLLRKL